MNALISEIIISLYISKFSAISMSIMNINENNNFMWT